MCRETVTFAQCAPHDPPVLTFNCGKLHMIAQDRIVCEEAKGKCICYFGTCGRVEREVPTKGIDLSEVTKVRCASCVVREDKVGDRRTGREILESPLLERPAISQAGWGSHVRLLMNLWRDKATCPYHAEALSEFSMTKPIHDEPIDTVAPIEEAVQHAAEVHLPTETAHNAEASDHDTAEINTSSIEPICAGTPDINIESVAAITEWLATDPATSDHVESVSAGLISPKPMSIAPASDSGMGIKNGLDREIGLETSRWAPVKSSESEVEDLQAKDLQAEDVQVKDLQAEDGEQPRRVPKVNFAFDPNNADKLRDATQKFASLKSSFLLGKAF
ncbi:hypothetical protein FHETE_7443 [Fusarium heterosporum]|uniref:Uncharacterized protein n=1 Tax=Fusarium heterosporum TaxID=42747 RepID=A0A8H5WMP3_FUSHE|nr:hypothetical protein FHETE_7443 [Fusarium heterosporum]